MAAIATSITNRTGITSSAGTAFVSHTYPPQAHHSTNSSAAPWIIPTQVRWSARKPVTWVRAKTKTKSKNSSREVTRCSLGSPPSFSADAESAVLIRCPPIVLPALRRFAYSGIRGESVVPSKRTGSARCLRCSAAYGQPRTSEHGLPRDRGIRCLSLRKELEVGNPIQPFVIVLGHHVALPVTQGFVEAAPSLVRDRCIRVEPAPALSSHELFGTADELRGDPPPLEGRVHREPLQLPKAVPLSVLDADEPAQALLRFADENLAARPWWQSAREVIEFGQLTSDVPLFP